MFVNNLSINNTTSFCKASTIKINLSAVLPKNSYLKVSITNFSSSFRNSLVISSYCKICSVFYKRLSLIAVSLSTDSIDSSLTKSVK